MFPGIRWVLANSCISFMLYLIPSRKGISHRHPSSPLLYVTNIFFLQSEKHHVLLYHVPHRSFCRPRLQSEKLNVSLYHVSPSLPLSTSTSISESPCLVVSWIPIASSVDLDFNLRNSMSRCIRSPHRFLSRPRVQSEKLHVLLYHVSGTVSPSLLLSTSTSI